MRSRITAIVVSAAILAGGYAAGGGGGGGGGEFSGACLVSNRAEWGNGGTECDFNTLITRTNQSWTCSSSLLSYGPLPIKVTISSTIKWPQPINPPGGDGAVNLDAGCAGDGNGDTIDLIIDISDVNGVTGGIGKTADSSKTRLSPGPTNIQLTGVFECGDPTGTSPATHPDAWQFQGASNIDIVNGRSGNYAAGTATCQSAGGIMFYSFGTNNDIDVIGGEYVGCNHGLNGGQNPVTNVDIIDAKFRTGRTESRNTGGDPNCDNFNPSDACINTSMMTLVNVTCQRWNATTDTWTTQTPS